MGRPRGCHQRPRKRDEHGLLYVRMGDSNEALVCPHKRIASGGGLNERSAMVTQCRWRPLATLFVTILDEDGPTLNVDSLTGSRQMSTR